MFWNASRCCFHGCDQFTNSSNCILGVYILFYTGVYTFLYCYIIKVKKKKEMSIVHISIWNRKCLFIFSFHFLIRMFLFGWIVWVLSEKEMASHSSTLAWKIPWAEEPGKLQSMGSLRVGHDWVTSLSLFTLMHWRRKWQPTPVFLPGESQGRGSLVGCHLWGHTDSDTPEVT